MIIERCSAPDVLVQLRRLMCVVGRTAPFQMPVIVLTSFRNAAVAHHVAMVFVGE